MLRFFSLILILTSTYNSLLSQSNVNQQIDSLTFEKSSIERANISNKIARKLKDTAWERAQHYLEYAEKEAKSSKSDKTLAKTYITVADIYYDKDVLDIALDFYQKAYNIYNKNIEKGEIFKLENDLAIIYARMNNKDKALYYFQKVYEYQLKQKDSLHLAKILNNIGTLYFKENTDSSEFYYLKSLKIAKKLNNTQLNAYLYTNLGRIYYLKNEQKEAQYFFEKALKTGKTDIDIDIKSMVFQLTSDFFLKTDKIDSSIYYAKKAIDLLKNNIYSFKNQDAVRTLYKAYIVKNDYKNASKYFELFDEIRDSINVEEKAVNIERLKLELEYKTKEEIRTLKENKQRFFYIIIGLSMISVLLILIIFLVKYKNRLSKIQLEKKLIEAKRNELRSKLELKNKTLISKAMTEIHRTEIIQSILIDLKQVKLKAVKKETELAVDFIIKRLSKELNTNIWNEFELSFEKVHENFIRNLNKKHPKLTAKDRRFCSLLLLNLSSKEISLIIGQSLKSVENARTRLRKKLQLTNTKTDLTAYLNSLS